MIMVYECFNYHNYQLIKCQIDKIDVIQKANQNYNHAILQQSLIINKSSNFSEISLTPSFKSIQILSFVQKLISDSTTQWPLMNNLCKICCASHLHNPAIYLNFWPMAVIMALEASFNYDKIDDLPAFEWKEKMDHNSKDYEQLQKDAQRSLSSMKTFETINKVHLKKRQNDVLMVLDNFFGHNHQLRYIQGFHDVASVFITIFGNNIGYFMMQKAGKAYFHDFLKFDVGHIGIAVSEIVLELVVRQDKQFEDIFSCFKETKFLIFIIPWIFTWFAHVFSSLKTICRIWDYILCTGPFGAIYLTAGIILTTKQQLIYSCQQFDQANIQSFYQKQAKQQSLDIQSAIQMAIQLQEKINVREFSGYQQFKADSMFRFQNFYKEVPLLEKHQKQMLEKKAKQQWNKNLKTAAIVVTTVTIGILAFKSSFLKNLFKGHYGQF